MNEHVSLSLSADAQGELLKDLAFFFKNGKIV